MTVAYEALRPQVHLKNRRVPLSAISLRMGHRGSEIGNETMDKSVDQGKQGLTPIISLIAIFRNFVRLLRQNIDMNKEPVPLNLSHPELIKEALGWDPSEFTAGSGKRKSWRCSEGHIWEAPIYARTGSGKKPTGCPVCSGKKRIVGINDLQTLHPEIASEADGWDPKTVGKGGGMRDWKCKLGHQWSATISNRTFFNSKCPVCLNQKVWAGFNDLATTHPELAKEAFGWDPTTVTAGSSRKKLAWKCSKGHSWFAVPYSRTGAKPKGCPTCANRVLQVGFNDLATTHPELAKEAFGWDPTTVVGGSHKIVSWKCSKGHTWKTPVMGRSGRERGCPICSNLVALKGFNDLATNFPHVAAEADGWDPAEVVFGTEKRLPWKCNLGHKWVTGVVKRTGVDATNCPICSGRKLLKGFNDLATTFPEMAREALGWDPTEVSAGNHTKRKWKCSEGHIWEVSPHGRKRGSVGCPTCSSSGYDPNVDAWLYFLKHEKWGMLQIGITNFPDQRLYRHKKNGWEVIEIRGPMDGYLTRDWESSILSTLGQLDVNVGPSDVAGKFDGYTEAWRISDYNVTSIADLMEAVKDQENKTN